MSQNTEAINKKSLKIYKNNSAKIDDKEKIILPFKRVVSLIISYASSRLSAQLKAVAFVVIYLFIAQTFILRVPVAHAFSVILGVGATVAGLAFFLEGLFLGIMPLGEQCGLRLPGKTGASGIALFAIIIGVTATLAEPAIGFLKIQGSAVSPWEAPLLYLLLNRGADWMVFAIAIGVGLAVLLGVFRFIYGWSFKPAVFILIPFLIIIGFIFDHDLSLRQAAALAWDTGGVTTGPVTVPLVIALGIGVSKISGRSKGGASGLGVVTLASALPVIAVFLLAFILSHNVPKPLSAADFFSAQPSIRKQAIYVAGSEEHLSEIAIEAVSKGFISSEEYKQFFPDSLLINTDISNSFVPVKSGGIQKILKYFIDAITTVLPLALVLIITLLFFLKEKIRNADEIILGLIFTVLGMFLFTFGMEKGISALGSQAGSALPKAYEKTIRNDKAVTVYGVTENSIFTVPGYNEAETYIWIQGDDGPVSVPFVSSQLNSDAGTYYYVPVENAVFFKWGKNAGLLVVLIFVFILGFGATLAEPSLAALGITVEEITTGTYKKSTLITSVAIGVGFGMALGFGHILFNIPLSWLLGIPYTFAIILTIFSSEEFAAIAWDAAGVTTGPVTVPLVIAAGLGIGGQSGSAGGAFGIVATASVFPILVVLLSGILNRMRAKKSIISET